MYETPKTISVTVFELSTNLQRFLMFIIMGYRDCWIKLVNIKYRLIARIFVVGATGVY